MRLLDRDPIRHDEQALKVQHVRSKGKKKFKNWIGKFTTKERWKNNNTVDDQEERTDSQREKAV